jgi:imidazole glycerol-phosphate synthase subunit HisF
MRHRVIPVLTIQNGGLVKSAKFKNHKYVGDPINAVKIFNDKEVDEIIILDISASRKKKPPNIEMITDIAQEAFMPLAYGGGIRSMDQVNAIFYAGVEKVILNQVLLQNPGLVSEIVKQYGSQSVIASLDVKQNIFGKKVVYDYNKKATTKLKPLDFALKMQELGAGEVFITSVDNEGTYKGYALDLIENLSDKLEIPVVACGGASSAKDFTLAIEKGASAVAASSMFVFQRPHNAVLISYTGI